MSIKFYINSEHILRFIEAVREENFEECAKLDVYTYEPFPLANYMEVSLNGDQAEALILNMMSTSSDQNQEDLPF
jgi:hypothetical protein